MREAIYLVKHGVPWDVVWQMSDARRLAIVTIIGEQDGCGKWDWDNMRWVN